VDDVVEVAVAVDLDTDGDDRVGFMLGVLPERGDAGLPGQQPLVVEPGDEDGAPAGPRGAA
jgi:hypothetical protein